MYKNIYIAFLFLCSPLFANLPQGNTVYEDVTKEDAIKFLQQINTWFHSTASYSYTVTHATYAGHQASVPYEQKKGYFKKYATGFHCYIMDVHSIQNKNYLITIDSSRKLILVNNPTRTFVGNKISIDDYIKTLDKCKTIKMIQKGKNKTLRIEFEKKFSVAAYEFTVGKDGLLHSILVFYAKEVKAVNGSMVKPKLSIAFEKFETGINPGKKELNESEFFALTNGSFQLNESYKGYTLLDQRIKNEKQK